MSHGRPTLKGRIFFVVLRIIPVSCIVLAIENLYRREVDVCVGAAASCFLVFGADFSSSRCGNNRERTGKADGRLRRWIYTIWAPCVSRSTPLMSEREISQKLSCKLVALLLHNIAPTPTWIITNIETDFILFNTDYKKIHKDFFIFSSKTIKKLLLLELWPVLLRGKHLVLIQIFVIWKLIYQNGNFARILVIQRTLEINKH